MGGVVCLFLPIVCLNVKLNLSKRKCVEAKLGLRCNGRVGGVVCLIVCLFLPIVCLNMKLNLSQRKCVE